MNGVEGDLITDWLGREFLCLVPASLGMFLAAMQRLPVWNRHNPAPLPLHPSTCTFTAVHDSNPPSKKRLS